MIIQLLEVRQDTLIKRQNAAYRPVQIDFIDNDPEQKSDRLLAGEYKLHFLRVAVM